MLKNYFIITFRNIWRNKTYSFLNILGLSVGIAAAAMIFLWVENELGYNDYFPNKNNLYIIKDKQTYDGNTFVFDATPGPLAAAIQKEIPGVKYSSRSTWDYNLLFGVDDKNIYQTGRYVDSSFLQMFSLQFIKGNPTTAFSEHKSIVVTEKMAKIFFGSTDIVGKTLQVNNKDPYLITGVVKDLPPNVSVKFEWLMSFDGYENNNDWLKYWGSNGIITYVEMQPNANIAIANKPLFDIVQRNNSQSGNAKMMLYPFTRIRLYNSFDNSGNEKEGLIKNIRLFSIIAWIILLIACINFMNLSTARSEKRAKEVGIRKVIGAGKGKLILQFLGESLTLSLLSTLLAIVLIIVSLPSFNQLVNKQLALNLLQPLHTAILLGIALVCGLIAGSYPAFYLSSFDPATVLKSVKLKSGSAAIIRKSLVVLQFSASVALIICTVIIYQQIQLGKNRDLGFDKQNLVTTSLQGDMRKHASAIRNELLSTGVVDNAAISHNNPLNMGSNTGDFSWEGKAPDKQVLITVEGVDNEYIPTMRMKLKEGRNFYPTLSSDSSNIIINESLASILPNKNKIGAIITRGNQTLTIIGVVKDFVSNNAYHAADPLILFADTSNTWQFSIRLKSSQDLSTSMAKIEKVIKASNPGYPFNYQFEDRLFDDFFKAETLIGKISGIFSSLAIFISCLGLFGLASFTAERRTKEIGIRKVLGASVSNITALLSRDFVGLVLISLLIASPVAWYIMFNWLKTFPDPYRIHIEWWVFAGAGMLSILIAILTVSFQSIKAATANPVKSLRTE